MTQTENSTVANDAVSIVTLLKPEDSAESTAKYTPTEGSALLYPSVAYRLMAKLPTTGFLLVPSGPGQTQLPSLMVGCWGVTRVDPAMLSMSSIWGKATVVSTVAGLDEKSTTRKEANFVRKLKAIHTSHAEQSNTLTTSNHPK